MIELVVIFPGLSHLLSSIGVLLLYIIVNANGRSKREKLELYKSLLLGRNITRYGITTRKDLNLCWLLCINKERVQLSFETCMSVHSFIFVKGIDHHSTLQHEMAFIL